VVVEDLISLVAVNERQRSEAGKEFLADQRFLPEGRCRVSILIQQRPAQPGLEIGKRGGEGFSKNSVTSGVGEWREQGLPPAAPRMGVPLSVNRGGAQALGKACQKSASASSSLSGMPPNMEA
jgi:hypothetical protein